MINFYEEINNYKELNKLSQGRLVKYVRALYNFCDFLSAGLGIPPKEVCLDRIYTLKSDERIIAHKPLDARIIDRYLMNQIENSFSVLEHITHALKSFIRFLTDNRKFPDIVPYMTFSLKDHNPAAKQIRILSRHEQLRFLQSLLSNSDNYIRDTIIFSLLLTTGCRVSEITNLKISEINFDEEMITLLETKNKKQRVVVLREGFGVVLRKYCSINQLSNHDWLFPIRNNQLPISRQYVSKLFKKYVALASMPDMRLHSLRHAFATYMRDEGVDLLTIMDLLGHEELQSTLNYTQPHYTRNANIKIKEHEDFYRKLRVKLKNKN